MENLEALLAMLFVEIENVDAFSNRTKNALKNIDLVYVGDILITTEPQLNKTKDIGQKSLKEIREYLIEKSLTYPNVYFDWKYLKKIHKDNNNLETMLKLLSNDQKVALKSAILTDGNFINTQDDMTKLKELVNHLADDNLSLKEIVDRAGAQREQLQHYKSRCFELETRVSTLERQKTSKPPLGNRPSFENLERLSIEGSIDKILAQTINTKLEETIKTICADKQANKINGYLGYCFAIFLGIAIGILAS